MLKPGTNTLAKPLASAWVASKSGKFICRPFSKVIKITFPPCDLLTRFVIVCHDYITRTINFAQGRGQITATFLLCALLGRGYGSIVGIRYRLYNIFLQPEYTSPQRIRAT